MATFSYRLSKFPGGSQQGDNFQRNRDGGQFNRGGGGFPGGGGGFPGRGGN